MFAQVEIVNCLFLRHFRLARVLGEILDIFSNELIALFEKDRSGKVPKINTYVLLDFKAFFYR